MRNTRIDTRMGIHVLLLLILLLIPVEPGSTELSGNGANEQVVARSVNQSDNLKDVSTKPANQSLFSEVPDPYFLLSSDDVTPGIDQRVSVPPSPNITINNDSATMSMEASKDSNIRPEVICDICNCPLDSGTSDIMCVERGLTTVPDIDQETVIWLSVLGELRLTLDGNNISLLRKFPPVSSLISISVRYNGLTKIDAYCFEDLEKLHFLDLSNNYLRRFGKLAFASTHHEKHEDKHANLPLQVLDLSHNLIKSLDGDTFEYLHKLETLRLNHNPISTLDSSTITAMNTLDSLLELHLSWTGISSLPETMVNPVAHLISLDLAGNNLDEVPVVLRLASHLENLNFAATQLSELRFGDFEGLSNLLQLNLSLINTLTSIHTGAFGSLTQLRTLRCNFNPQLSYVSADAFKTAGQFRTLELREVLFNDNNLTRLDKQVLPWITVQENLNLQGNPWSCDCYSKWIRDLELNPEFIPNIECSSPPEVHKQALKSVDIQVFRRCPPSSTANVHHHSSGASLGVSLTLGAVLVASAAIVAIFVCIIVRKRSARYGSNRQKSSVRYTKANESDNV